MGMVFACCRPVKGRVQPGQPTLTTSVCASWRPASQNVLEDPSTSIVWQQQVYAALRDVAVVRWAAPYLRTSGGRAPQFSGQPEFQAVAYTLAAMALADNTRGMQRWQGCDAAGGTPGAAA